MLDLHFTIKFWLYQIKVNDKLYNNNFKDFFPYLFLIRFPVVKRENRVMTDIKDYRYVEILLFEKIIHFGNIN